MYRALNGEDSSIDDLEVHAPSGPAVLEAFGSPIRDVDGKVMFGVAAYTDITERRRISEELNKARIAAEESTAAKSAFLANMSHEIRTPLNGILGMAELVLDANLSPEDRKSVELIMQSGEILLHVINDILDFSKIEAGQLEIEATEVDVERLVGSTVRIMMPSAAQRGFEIVADVRAGVPACVLADPTRVRQVLTNLIGNAVKFTHTGEVAVVVERVDDDTTPTEHTRLRFSVRDTGVGIAPEKLSTIFEAFRQADTTTTRRYGGTGLGLSISRRLVELMGGRLEASSVEGVGSTFSFELTVPITEARVPAPLPSARLEGMRMLVVDDNATNRRVISGVLRSAHCEVLEAMDAATGLEMLRAAVREGRTIDIVITDRMMPGTDGFDFARAIRADPQTARTRVVIASSVNRRGDAAVSRELDIAAYLLKPVSRTELLETLKGVVSETPSAALEAIEPVVAPQAIVVVPLRVLLAEDNVVNQEVASAVLRRRGHGVTIVSSGRAAVDAVADGEYDVVLMDLQMPELDGFEATAEIRRLPGAHDLHVIALTANAMTGERERCIAAGMDDYVAKPFKAAELLAAVERRERRSAAPDAETHGPAVDLVGFRESLESGGVGALFGSLIAMFVSDSPARIEALQAAAAGGDATQVERAAHALKSGAATLRATRLAALLGELERSARAGEAGRIPTLVADVTAAYSDVLRALHEASHG